MKNLPIIIFAVALTVTACNDKEEITVQAPLTYEFIRGGESTVSFSGQTTRIAMGTELVSGLANFDKTTEQLLEMYANQSSEGGDVNPFTDEALNTSTKSIKSKVAASADFFSTDAMESGLIKDQIEEWISGQVNEINANSNQAASPGIIGQIADGTTPRYVSGKGIEYNQLVNKALIGALMVDQISNNYLSTAVLDAGTQISDNNSGITAEGSSYTEMEHKWDEAYGYLFGGSANPTEPLLTLGDDIFLNKYLSRVDSDEDFTGIAQEIYDAFKLGRAAIVEHDYELRDAQAEIINELLAQIIAIRSVYYLQSAKDAIAVNDMGAAFHDLSEGYGFIYSLRFVKQPGSNQALYTLGEIENFTSQLTEGNGFWDVTSETLDGLSETIASRFDFTVEQAYSF